jgi:ABC-2 type transport system permease protein
MKTFLGLCALYVRSVMGVDLSIKGKSPKKVIGAVLLGVLILISLLNFAFLGGMTVWEAYDALARVGLQSMSLLNAISMATMIVILFGFLTVMSTYFVSEAETALIALPVTARQMLGAKMAMVYVTEVAVSFLMLAGAIVAYGIKSAANPGFYALGFAVALATPLLPVALSYLVAIPFIKAFRFLRSKNAIMVIGGFVGIAFAMLYNLWNQTMLAKLSEPEALAAMMASPESLPSTLASLYPPARFALDALISPGAAGAIGWLLALFALGLGSCALVAFALGGAYLHGLTRFNESRLKRLKDVKSFIGREIGERPLILTLLKREVDAMNREPVYLLNGPFVIVLLPVMMAIMFFAQGDTLAASFGRLGDLGPWTVAGLAALAGAALGSMTSVSATSVSREGKAFFYLKALPVDPAELMRAKLAHGAIFSVLGVLFGAVGLGTFLGCEPLPLLAGIGAALAYALFHDALMLYVDALMPKLNWENPIAAVKQNVNAVIGIFVTFGLIGGSIALKLAAGLESHLLLALIGGACAISFVALLAYLPRFSRARFAAIE